MTNDQLWLNSTTRARPDPTRPDRTRTDFFAARVSEKLRWVRAGLRQSPCGSGRVRAGPVGSGRARVVEFSLYRITMPQRRPALAYILMCVCVCVRACVRACVCVCDRNVFGPVVHFATCAAPTLPFWGPGRSAHSVGERELSHTSERLFVS